MDWPVKTKDIHNHHMDSTVWDDFKFRNDDIVIATYAKAGTTWTQQIIGQLIFGGEPSIQTEELSPWLDIRIMPKEVKFETLDNQTHRRFIKTHLPVDALVFNPQVKYLYIARDCPDIAWSMHNHLYRATEEFYELFNDTPGRVGPPIERPSEDIYEFWKAFIENDGYPLWSMWENFSSWWKVRHLPNVKLIHFNDLKKDMESEIRSIADFLNISVSNEQWPAILEHCSFDWMKKHAAQLTPLGGQVFQGGAATFINKGENKRWKEILNQHDMQSYQARAIQELGEECAQWVFNGKTIES